MNVQGFCVLAALLLLSGCGVSGESASPSSDPYPNETSPRATAARQPEPPPAPSTEGKVEIQLTVESQQSTSTTIRSQLANGSDAPAFDVRMQILQRWESGDWKDVAVLPYTAGASHAVRACDPAKLDACAVPNDEPNEVEPGELGRVRRVVVNGLEAGTYRVIEPIDLREPKFRPDPRVVSRHLDIDASEPVTSTEAPGPAPAPTTSAAVAFDIELVDENHLGNLTATGIAAPSVEVGGFWLMERWRDDQWVTFAHIGDSTSTSGTIRICLEAEGAEDCEQSLESRELQPGQYSFRHNVNIGVLPPGTYRVRLDSSAESTSDHLVVDSAGVSVVEREM